MLDCYDHLNFGTISDIVAPYYPDNHFREAHFWIFENPELLRGQWRKDATWFAAQQNKTSCQPTTCPKTS
jgi:hypothetical protein